MFGWCILSDEMFLLIVIFLQFLSDVAKAQSGGTLPSGDSYICVPAGYCDNNGNVPSGSGIDPRIVTPSTSLCPAGQIACYTQGPNSKCGTRFITQTNTADGLADEGAYPWQVYLQNSTNTYAGSGVLLDNWHVLTAAHKVADSVSNPGNFKVLLGVFNPTSATGVQTSTVAEIILQDNYAKDTLRNDLAILQLATPISLSSNNVNTACLPAAGASYVGQRCVVSGWGQTSFTSNDAPTNPMKQVYVNIVDYATCRTSYSAANLLGTNVDLYLDEAGEICAGGEAMKDACTQDGGSPLVCPDSTGKNSIAGLVIWGKNCGQAGVYGVYVSVPAYRNWIDTTITSLYG